MIFLRVCVREKRGKLENVDGNNWEKRVSVTQLGDEKYNYPVAWQGKV